MSGYKVGLACARNAAKNDMGFAPKQRPVAGNSAKINLRGMRMEVNLDPDGLGSGYLLDLMARNHINPVLLQDYGNSQSQFEFGDCLTQYMDDDKDLKLESVAERAMDIDSRVVGLIKEVNQGATNEVIQEVERRLENLFDDAAASNWLESSTRLGDKPYSFVVGKLPNTNDGITVEYSLHYVGTNRQMFVQQTVV